MILRFFSRLLFLSSLARFLVSSFSSAITSALETPRLSATISIHLKFIEEGRFGYCCVYACKLTRIIGTYTERGGYSKSTLLPSSPDMSNLFIHPGREMYSDPKTGREESNGDASRVEKFLSEL